MRSYYLYFFIALLSFSACEFTLGDADSGEPVPFESIQIDPAFNYSTLSEISLQLPDGLLVDAADIYAGSDNEMNYLGRYSIHQNSLDLITASSSNRIELRIPGETQQQVYSYDSKGNLISTKTGKPANSVEMINNDRDGDGTIDRLDQYPDDPERSRFACFPNCTGYATILFEDQWPSKGDYDFNDLVMNYRIKYVANHNNKVVEMHFTTQVIAVGGAMYHALFFNLQMDPSLIESVSGNLITDDNFLEINPNGTEAGLDEAVIPIFDVSKKVLPPPAGYEVTNVLESQPYQQPVEFTTTVRFKEPVSSSLLTRVPHDPFIVVDFERGREIHLPGELPTSKIDKSLLNTKDDHFLDNKGHSYKTVKGHPWVLNLPGAIGYPKENMDFSESYLDFSLWAESKGKNHKSWFDSQKARINRAKLYRFK
jgi:LruC domain-containing protein